MNELLTSDGQDFFTSYDEVYDSFDAMGLQEDLLRGIYAYGFEKPSTIQQRGIVPFCKGLDVIRQAQSNAGKNATFCSGILQQLDCSSLECQALVLAPTRELAQQIEKGLEKPSAIQQRGIDVIQQAQFGTVKTLCSGILQQLDYSLLECQALVVAPTRELAQQIEKVMRALGVKVHACVGGTSVREDHRILSSGVHVVVGTPGPVFNMLSRQSLRPNNMKMFVLDEADEMLSRGFKDQIYDIFQLLPTQSQAGQVQVHLLCAGKRAIRHYSASTREPRRTSCRPLERRPRRLSQSTSSKILSSPRHG